MGNLVKSNPARSDRDGTIAAQRLQGATYREIAKANGISKTSVHRILNDDEVKDVIATGTREMVALVPQALDNYREFLTGDDDKIKLTASQDVLKNTSISPSHNTNNMIVQINTGSRPDLAPEVLKLLQIHNDQADDIIDIDLELDK